jgi:CRP-like cAMP-binding protein
LKSGEIGKAYFQGEVIVSEGEAGDCLYVIQEGTVEIMQLIDTRSVHLEYLKEGDLFGEVGMFVDGIRPTTVRAMEKVRILTIDRKNFLKRLYEDSSFAYNVIKNLSERISRLHISKLQFIVNDRRNWDTRPKEYTRNIDTKEPELHRRTGLG